MGKPAQEDPDWNVIFLRTPRAEASRDIHSRQTGPLGLGADHGVGAY